MSEKTPTLGDLMNMVVDKKDILNMSLAELRTFMNKNYPELSLDYEDLKEKNLLAHWHGILMANMEKELRSLKIFKETPVPEFFKVFDNRYGNFPPLPDNLDEIVFPWKSPPNPERPPRSSPQSGGSSSSQSINVIGEQTKMDDALAGKKD